MNSSLSVDRPIRRIACIQLGGEFPDFCHRMVMPDYGMPFIGSVLANAGYEVTVFMEHVQPPDWEAIVFADVVCMSTLSAGADKTYRLAEKIREELKIPVILGGTHATYFPESCLEYCDYVVLGEGDETILDLCGALSQGKDISQIVGIVYKKDGQLYCTPKRPPPRQFNTIPNFALIKGYKKMSRIEILKTRRLPLLTVQSTRGCPFSCKYCIVDTMFSGGYFTRDIDSVIRDLRDKRQYGNELLFVDNNFGANRAYTKKLLRRMIEEDFGFDIMVLTRINIAQYDELLELMRQAGISQLYQGYESIHPDTLDAYDKRQTVERITKAVDKLHAYGFRLSGSFIFGADTDSVETIRATVRFVLDQNLSIAYFFPLWGHYAEIKNQGTSLIPWHRSIFKGWAYCDGNFVTHFPLLMRPSVLQKEIIDAHREVFSLTAVAKSIRRGDFVSAWEKALHRWMWSVIEQATLVYIPWLEALEEGLYDASGQLIVEKLVKRAQEPSWPVFPENCPEEAIRGNGRFDRPLQTVVDQIGCTSPITIQ